MGMMLKLRWHLKHDGDYVCEPYKDLHEMNAITIFLIITEHGISYSKEPSYLLHLFSKYCEL